MTSIILAAGYATRLYPLTENFPKPLLDVQGKSILDRLLEDIDRFPEIDRHVIVSNHKFFATFAAWKATKAYAKPIEILDDGTETNESRLGAVKDIALAVKACGISDDILVLAGDNVLDFSLRPFVEYQRRKGASAIMRHYQGDRAALRKTGVVTVDENDAIVLMEEKPQNPKSNWAVPPFYIYSRDDIGYFEEGIEQGCPTDAPGDFISWFSSRKPVYAYEMPGKRYDVGDLASYERIQQVSL